MKRDLVNTSMEEKQPLLKYMHRFADSHQGFFIKQLPKNNYFLFQCSLKHKFVLAKGQIMKGFWCQTCYRTLQAIRRSVRNRGGEVLTETLKKLIKIRCKQGHEFELKYRKVVKQWCKECSKNNKQLLKQLIENENKKIEKEQRMKQNKILEEAKQKYLLKLKKQQDLKRMSMKKLNQVQQEVEALSTKYTLNYLHS